ncbi:bcl-2-like protein 2 [Phymastichus coffea]|uniref:bcl-2-like protein 2 n=1 Tax=Phymastichus coffea TaxID=108790 RepID=UPI00273CD38D|nr:bcl-2-like protein 2 [Phymastichus coffea]XP_058794470.1 bcl-2-like protein 2 [Phymastichus coffea]XP_058794471.1 bcl-2-like protein 2 [Phymastichus coffea]
MAGDRVSTNNESRDGGGGEDEVEGVEPHSRVGGIPECAAAAVVVAKPSVVDGLCRYAQGATSGGLSFLEVCQIRLQQSFPQISTPQRSSLCEDSIELTAECLADDVIRYLLKEDIYQISRDPISRSMCHNVYQMLNKHSILFTSMVNRLNVTPDTAYEAFMGVADELFLCQGITWARIVCLYAFMGRLALWARDRRMHTLKKKLPKYVARYIGEEISQFIKICGGWEQLCLEYPVAEEMSGTVWRSLLMTGATLGLVATILSVTS